MSGKRKSDNRIAGIYKEPGKQRWRVTWYEERHRRDAIHPTLALAEAKVEQLKRTLIKTPERELSGKVKKAEASVTWQEPLDETPGGTAQQWLHKMWQMMETAEMIMAVDEEDRIVNKIHKTLNSAAKLATAAKGLLDLTHATKSLNTDYETALNEEALFQETLQEIKKNPKLFKAVKEEYDNKDKKGEEEGTEDNQ